MRRLGWRSATAVMSTPAGDAVRTALPVSKLLAAFRGELLSAVTAQSNVISAQTRTLVLANIGALLSVAALAFGAARLT
jgi:hypothetical protein